MNNTETARQLFAFCMVLLLTSVAPHHVYGQSFAETSDENATAVTELPSLQTPKTRWSLLYSGRPNQNLVTLPESFPCRPISGLKLKGPHVGHPFLLGDFEAKGEWAIVQGGLQRVTMEDGLLGLANVADFDAEVALNAEGLGGFLILLGWENGHGYAIYNVTLKESGSPWHLCEFRDHAAIEESDREFQRFEFKGSQTLALRVQQGKLGIKVDRQLIGNDLPVPNYSQGMLAIGTYDTRYEAKPLRMMGIRVKSLK